MIRPILLFFLLIALPTMGQAQLIRAAQVKPTDFFLVGVPALADLDMGTNQIIMDGSGIPGILFDSTLTHALLVNGPNTEVRPRDNTGLAAMRILTSGGAADAGFFANSGSGNAITRVLAGDVIAWQSLPGPANKFALDGVNNLQMGDGVSLYSLIDGGSEIGSQVGRMGTLRLADLPAPKSPITTPPGELWMTDAPPSGHLDDTLLYWDGSDWIQMGKAEQTFGRSDGDSTSTGGGFQLKLSVLTPACTCTVMVRAMAEMNNSNTGGEITVRLQNVTDVATMAESIIGPANNVNWHSFSALDQLALSGTAKNLEVQFEQTGPGTATIRRARIYIERIN